MKRESIGVDLDGTIAEHHEGQEEIGPPIRAMLNRVKRWVAEGQDVWIFTARGGSEDQRTKIKDWLEKHGLPRLPVTNVKMPQFHRIYDDRSVPVAKNRGTILTERRSSHRRIFRR